MRKWLLLTFLAVSTSVLKAQTQPDYASVKMEAKEDYTPEVNKMALGAAVHILSTPINKQNLSRLQAAAFLIRWMSGTPEYSFELGAEVEKMTKGNDDLLIVYMAALARNVLEHPELKGDAKKLKVAAVSSLLDYCKEQQVKMNGELNKWQKAKEAGELEAKLG